MNNPLEAIQCTDRILKALNISIEAPADPDLLTLLDLAAISPDVAAFLSHPLPEPPEELIARFAHAGLAWSKVQHHLLPRLHEVMRALAQYQGNASCLTSPAPSSD